MGSTADKLNYLQETKTAIKNAIIAKGVSVGEEDTFRSYASKIAEIEGGGGSTEPESVYENALSLRKSLSNLTSDTIIGSDGTIDLSNTSNGTLTIPNQYFTYTGETIFLSFQSANTISNDQQAIIHSENNFNLSIDSSGLNVYDWNEAETYYFSSVTVASNKKYYASITLNSNQTNTVKVGETRDLSNAESITVSRKTNQTTFPVGINLGYAVGLNYRAFAYFYGKLFLQLCYMVDANGEEIWRAFNKNVQDVTLTVIPKVKNEGFYSIPSSIETISALLKDGTETGMFSVTNLNYNTNIRTLQGLSLADKDWEICAAVRKPPTQKSSPRGIFGCLSGVYSDRFNYPLLSYTADSTAKVELWMSGNGTSWDLASGVILEDIIFGLPHYVKLSYDRTTSTYALSVAPMTDNNTPDDAWWASTTTFTGGPVYNETTLPFCFGYNLEKTGVNFDDGLLDFSRTYIEINGERHYIAIPSRSSDEEESTSRSVPSIISIQVNAGASVLTHGINYTTDITTQETN